MVSLSYSISIIILSLIFPLFLLIQAPFTQNESEPVPSVDYSFGQSIDFSLRIDDASDVEQITLYVQPVLSSNLYVVNVPFDPADIITATYSITPATLNLEPYTDLAYSWEIDTSSGSVRIPERHFSYEDDRFVWQKMSQGAATVHWTGNGPFFGQSILDIAISAQDKLSEVLPLDYLTPYNIYVYPSSADLRTGLSLANVEDIESGQPDMEVILVTSVNPQTAVTDLEISVPYELTHLLLSRLAEENYAQFPWWLKEGIAQSVQARPHPRQDQILSEAIAEGATIPLWRLCQAPVGNADRALLASVESLSLIEFIKSRYGEPMLINLVAAYSKGDNCEVGVRRILNKSLDELNDEWRATLNTQSPIQEFLQDYGLWFLLIAAIIIFGVWLIWFSVRINN